MNDLHVMMVDEIDEVSCLQSENEIKLQLQIHWNF